MFKPVKVVCVPNSFFFLGQTDAESDGEGARGGEGVRIVSTWPPGAITFDDVDITSHALRNMVAMGHSVEQSAASQTSVAGEDFGTTRLGIGRLWQQERYHDAIIDFSFITLLIKRF